ncbi:MAG TPA: DUF6599 family protein [Candidatus Sulfotelmatobacter sp.]|nr:DUF6599 family protein [Candidatus Sulfotelmatobacter sp.]
MQKQLIVFVLASVLFATGASAPTPILPDHFGAWESVSPAKTLRTQDLGTNWAQWTNGEKVLAEAGLQRIEQRAYRNGNDEVTLRVFSLRDPSSAYEFYTFLLAPGMRNLGLGEDSALSQYDARFLVGNFVVQATLSKDAKPESLNEILGPLKTKADPTPLPPLKSYLPDKWRIFGSEKYALGPEALRAAMTSLNQGAYANLSQEVGFQSGAEAMMARYQGEHGSGVLLLIEYPTPQLAENHLHHLEQALPAAAKKAGVSVERKASMLSLVFAATSPMHAQAIRDEVNYETEVTWNEPSQTATEPPLVYMMFKIFLFTSLFMVVATIAGIAFGGFRVLIKHWLPGKVFDRPKDIEVLQLGLSGKKIDPTDMY